MQIKLSQMELKEALQMYVSQRYNNLDVNVEEITSVNFGNGSISEVEFSAVKVNSDIESTYMITDGQYAGMLETLLAVIEREPISAGMHSKALNLYMQLTEEIGI